MNTLIDKIKNNTYESNKLTLKLKFYNEKII